MERKLKFRVWTGNGMEYSVVVGEYGVFYVNPENGTGLDPRDTASLTPNNTKYHDDAPVMQYSGLNDKNGKEIYEGDIVKQIFPAGPKKKDGMIEEVDVVKFESGQFEVDAIPLYVSGDFNVEVIGNIYENPELLK